MLFADWMLDQSHQLRRGIITQRYCQLFTVPTRSLLGWRHVHVSSCVVRVQLTTCGWTGSTLSRTASHGLRALSMK